MNDAPTASSSSRSPLIYRGANQAHPCAIEVEPGQTYLWCRCGRSESQPFCDGSHQGTGITPLSYQSQHTRIVWFCGCKKTGNPPFCDGSHKDKNEPA